MIRANGNDSFPGYIILCFSTTLVNVNKPIYKIDVHVYMYTQYICLHDSFQAPVARPGTIMLPDYLASLGLELQPASLRMAQAMSNMDAGHMRANAAPVN